MRTDAIASPALPDATTTVMRAIPNRSRLDSYLTGGMMGKKCGFVAKFFAPSLGDDASRV